MSTISYPTYHRDFKIEADGVGTFNDPQIQEALQCADLMDLERDGIRAEIARGFTHYAAPVVESPRGLMKDAHDFGVCQFCAGPLNSELSCRNQCAGNGRD